MMGQWTGSTPMLHPGAKKPIGSSLPKTVGIDADLESLKNHRSILPESW
jgi:hypothetical protein